jgi:hypothetical protein
MSTAMGGYGNSSSMHIFRPHLTRPAGLCCKALVVVAGMLLTTAPYRVNGATISARSPALADVMTAITLAKEGDIVSVPAGTASWNSVLTITKGITLQGATTVANAGTKSATANDLTVIKDDSPLNTTSSGLIKAKLSPAQSFRLTGFTFTHGSRTSLNGIGVVHLTSGTGSSPTSNMRVDHCHFDHIYARNIQTDGWAYGVADHNYIVAQGNGNSFYINCGNYGGYTLGHGAWADYPWFGTNKFFFIEDNTIVGNGSVPTSGAIDAEYGARYVVRHNDFTNCRPGWHGTEGGNRGCRAVEIYDNSFHWTMIPTAMNRSGTALIHDNKWDGNPSSNSSHSQIALFRGSGAVSANTTYGMADGTSPWDMNDTEGNGTYVEGHAPHLFDSGTATSGSGGTLTDLSKHWTPNQWVGFSLKQTTASSPCYPKGSYIISNTSNTITYSYYPFTDRGPTLQFSGGQTYQIHRILVMMDQVGRGKGDLLSGTTTSATNTVTGRDGWPHQALEPAMSWNNKHLPDNIVYGFSTSVPTERQGKDYYNLGAGFSADSTPSQVTSIYTAALNGSNYTGTYTYPHPLTSGLAGPSAPSPPTDLKIVP